MARLWWRGLLPPREGAQRCVLEVNVASFIAYIAPYRAGWNVMSEDTGGSLQARPGKPSTSPGHLVQQKICKLLFLSFFVRLRVLWKPAEFKELIAILSPLAMERQDEIIPEHPNSSNIRCNPLDKRCIQKNFARNSPKATNQRTIIAREETKAVLVRLHTCREESFGL